MKLPIARIGVGAGAVIASVAFAACGIGGLSASSSCKDFMSSSFTSQHELVDKLASDYRKPDFATPLGEPEVAYYCSANPTTTLADFFQKAEG